MVIVGNAIFECHCFIFLVHCRSLTQTETGFLILYNISSCLIVSCHACRKLISISGVIGQKLILIKY